MCQFSINWITLITHNVDKQATYSHSSFYPTLSEHPADYRISGRITGYCDRKTIFVTKFFITLQLGSVCPSIFNMYELLDTNLRNIMLLSHCLKGFLLLNIKDWIAEYPAGKFQYLVSSLVLKMAGYPAQPFLLSGSDGSMNCKLY